MLICSHKRKPMLDLFPSTGVDMFPITTGVEKTILIAINATPRHVETVVLMSKKTR
ncbi:MAG: hypothetical protein ACOWWR_17350 [Eubacteriales bacterium]